MALRFGRFLRNNRKRFPKSDKVLFPPEKRDGSCYSIESMRYYTARGIAHVFCDGIVWVKVNDWVNEGPIAVYWYSPPDGTFYLLRFSYYTEEQGTKNTLSFRLPIFGNPIKDIFLDDFGNEKLKVFDKLTSCYQKRLKNKRECEDKTKYHKQLGIPSPFMLYGTDITL